MCFGGFFQRKVERKKATDLKVERDGMKIQIISNMLSITPDEAEEIATVISEELKVFNVNVAYWIARRIVCETCNGRICAAQVSGSQNARDWLVNVSANSNEFID